MELIVRSRVKQNGVVEEQEDENQMAWARQPNACSAQAGEVVKEKHHTLNGALPAAQTTAAFQEALSHGQGTEKEKALREFVLSAYGDTE